MAKPTGQEISSNQEYLLLDYVERIGRMREGRNAVHIHLSRLKLQNRREHHVRIAVNTFETMVKPFEGQIFKLANQDIVFIFKDVRPVDIDEAVMRLRYLFNDDPISRAIEDTSDDGFCTWYDVSLQYPDLLATANALYEEVQKRQKRLALIPGNGGGEKPPINPHRLGELIDTIAKADLTNVMRRQAVFAILSTHPPQPLFRELFISIPELGKLILPNYNIVANRWLFQFLTETLDKRMLSLLMRNDDPAIANSFSLNLNVSTILSQEFMNFDASLKSGARGTIVLELQMIDIYADIGAYTFARDFARDRGYRICLDSMTETTMQYIDREKLGVDLIKLMWSREMGDQRSAERRQKLREIVERTGKAKVIMCHVDNDEGIKFGQSVGIAMYQGRHIDQLLAPKPGAVKPR